MKRFLNKIGKVLLPLLLAAAILWWMYRHVAWADIQAAVTGEMRWSWMLWSMPFGVLAQVFRATRWRQSLHAMGEHPRLSTSIHAVFISYASSLVVPRIGEVLRCGILKRWDGVRFTGSVGTVVSERVVDMLIMLLLTLVTVVSQIPVFASFLSRTGMSFAALLSGFTTTGYVVTTVCGLVTLFVAIFFGRRLRVLSHTRGMWSQLMEGILSVRRVKGRWLFLARSLAIWVCYYLHFYLTFMCFQFTEGLGPLCALVAFVVGTFAVLVPTPNGAGSWHFAVKTVLVLYSVDGTDAALFVLIVHTLQTLLVALLGLWAVAALALTRKHS